MRAMHRKWLCAAGISGATGANALKHAGMTILKPMRRLFDALRIREGLILHSEWRLLIAALIYGAICSLYFAVSFALPGPGFFIGATAILLVLLWRRRMFRHSAGVAVLSLMLALTFSSIRVASVAGPRLEREQFVSLEGVVTDFDLRPDRSPRLTVKPQTINGRSENLPHLVRVLVKTRIEDDVAEGASVSFKAMLSPPSGPVVPGGYDFGRAAFFQGVGAEGYAASAIVAIEPGEDRQLGLRQGVDRLRTGIASTLLDSIPGQAGAVAVALTVGDRRYIDEPTAEAIRDAGLAHLLAISGLHMGLVTAAVFFVLEYLFSAVPMVALRVRPKKIAAIVAWAVALAYLLISGMGIATIRAFVMISIGILAILSDRRVLSLRSIAIAALAILVIWPEAVLGVSFQMSFAATAALIAVYERLAAKGWFVTSDTGPLLRLVRFIGAMGLTSLIAQVAVAPFALYHFQTISLIGVLVNVIVVPMMSIAIMPLALLTLVLLPFGLHEPVSALLGFGLEQVLWLARYFSDFSFSVYRAGAPSDVYLMLEALLFCAMLLIWNLGITGFLFGLYLSVLALPFGKTADILIDNEGRVIARPDRASARLLIIGGRRDGFRDESWNRYWGLNPHAKPGALHRHCDSDACRTALDPDHHVTVLKALSALRPACNSGDILIGPRRWRRYCTTASYLAIEEFALRGPAAVRLADSSDPSAEDITATVIWAGAQGNRPWHWKKPEFQRNKPIKR